jgi:TRAP-type uncharacterized transport system fused permease subunit
MFAYEPSLLFVGSPWNVLTSSITATIGVVMLAAGLFGYFLRATTVLERGMLLVGSILLIKPGIYTDIVGLVLLIAVIGFQKMRGKAVSV